MHVQPVAIAFVLCAGMASAQGLDHAPFDALLRAHVKNGVVDYGGFQGSDAFRKYVGDLGKPVQLERKADRLAYYINAYNALAIEGILEGLSPSSLLGRARYFKYKEWPLNGQSMTLYDLEHRMLRPLNEPRIHFAIVCASKSCPLLRSEAYTASRLESQLDEQTKQFVNDPFRNRFDKPAKTAHLSEIFKWYDDDFRAAGGSTPQYVARYVNDPDVAAMLASGAYKVEWIDYDWNLNGAPPKR